MPSPSPADVKFEIGHVLFIDIVGYSRLLITEQREQLQTLKKIIRATEQFRLAEAEGKLLRLPTGDGGALVFRTSPDALTHFSPSLLRSANFSLQNAQFGENQCKSDSLGSPMKDTLRKAVNNDAKTR